MEVAQAPPPLARPHRAEARHEPAQAAMLPGKSRSRAAPPPEGVPLHSFANEKNLLHHVSVARRWRRLLLGRPARLAQWEQGAAAGPGRRRWRARSSWGLALTMPYKLKKEKVRRRCGGGLARSGHRPPRSRRPSAAAFTRRGP